ncbi:PRCC [Branchiostoma lanceolatum]|uniref:PRCC protein n=1 Tax=Branchiostoma lanceolatum TaxID=7740 RepID=A0A8J9ZK52_BRALA|nr:PRCC [Branchiostoma lanceolatum]
MALVAYGSSGESDSDDEEAQRPPPSLSSVTTAKPAAARSSLGLPPPKNTRSGERSGLGIVLPSPKRSTQSFVSEGEVKDVEDKRKKIGLHLPPPKTQKTDQEAPKSSRSSLFSTLPPPKSSSTTTEAQPSHETGNKTKLGSLVGPRRREPVKIAIPALPEPDSDEEDEPAAKKQKASVQGSGLASLLPAPKGSAVASIFSKKSVASSTTTTATSSNVKENTTIFNKKEDFVPYTLTKNKPSATSTGTSSTKTAQGQNSTASSSTVVSKKKNPIGVGPAEPIQTASAAKLAKLNMLKKLTKEDDSAKDDGSDEEDQSTNFFSLGDSKDDVTPSPDQEVRVPFPVEPTLAYSTAPGTSSSVSTSVSSSTFQAPYVNPDPYNQYSEAGPYMQYNQPYDYSDYNQQSYPDDTVQEGSSQQQFPPQPVAGPYVQDEMFVRMQGKKNRGEEIKIIDVHEDSQRAKMEDWKIQMDAEEREFMMSRSKKSGKLPSRQQRNKHQITYLAFQAKERELELKNQWSQNRMTKRQTQAKYGF